jgi:anti-sigma factor ChrR (cupin superfamily)
MTRSCCPSCRLRFSPATAAHLRACPFCAAPVHLLPASAIVGFSLVAIDPLVDDEPAIAETVALLPPSTSTPPPTRGWFA